MQNNPDSTGPFQIFGRPAPSGLGSAASRRSLWLDYSFSLIVAFSLVLLHLAFGTHLAGRVDFALLLLPILFSAFLGGMGPGLLATLICAAGSLLATQGTTTGAGSPPWITAVTLAGCGILLSLLSERLHRQRNLAEAGRQLQFITLGSVGEAIIVCDAGLRVSFLNPPAEELTGWRNLPAQGRTLADVFYTLHEQTRLPLDPPAAQVLASGQTESLSGHSLLTAQDGREYLIDGTVSPIRTPEGQCYGVVLIFRNCTQERAAETALLHREQQLSTTLERLPVGIGLLSDRIIQEGNPQLCQLLGYDAETLSNLPTRLLYDSDASYEQVGIDTYRQLGTTGQAILETRWRRQDGTWIDVLVAASLRQPGDMQRGIVFAALDLSRYKAHEQALQEQERQHHLILDSTRTGCGQYHPASHRIRLDALARQHYRLSGETHDLDAWLQGIHPDDQDAVRACLPDPARARLNGDTLPPPRQVEHRLRTDAGELRWLRLGFSPFAQEGAAITLISVQDISDIRQQQQTLQSERNHLQTLLDSRHEESARQQHYLQTLLDGIPFLIWFKDKEGRYLLANRATAEACGKTPEQMLGRCDTDFWPEDMAARYQQDDREVLRSGEPLLVEEPLADQRNPRGMCWIETGKFPVFDAARQILGTAGFARDLSERKALEATRDAARQEGERLRRGRGELLTSLSQELQSVLTDMAGQTAQARQTADVAQARQYLEQISQHTGHLHQYLQELGDFARMEAGQLELLQEAFPLGDSIDHAVRQALPLAQGKNLLLEVSEAADLPTACMGDGSRLGQLLAYLLQHAVRATTRGTVHLEIGCTASRQLRLTLCDGSSGLNPADLESLFNPFEPPADKTLARLYPARERLRLAISRHLIRHMGGNFGLQCLPRQGCTFDITLPLPAAREIPGQPSLHGVQIACFGLSNTEMTALAQGLAEQGASLQMLKAGDHLPPDIRLVITEAHTAISGGLPPASVNRLQSLQARGVAVAILASSSAIRMLPASLRRRWLERPLRLRHLLPLLNPHYRHPAADLMLDSLTGGNQDSIAFLPAASVTPATNSPRPAQAQAQAGESAGEARPEPVKTVPAASAGPLQPEQATGQTAAAAPPAPVPAVASVQDSLVNVLFTAIDWESLSARYPGKHESLIRLVSSVLYHHRDTGQRLQAALRQRDFRQIASLCQTLKQAAERLLARPLADLAQDSEQAALAAVSAAHSTEAGARAAAEVTVQAQLPLLLEALDAVLADLRQHVEAADGTPLMFQVETDAQEG